nr:hypothetical protein [Tanacetum cinerariifolium]
MANLPPPNNNQNIPEDDQAPAAPDGFAPQWIGGPNPNNNNGWIVMPSGATVTVSSTYEVGGPSTTAAEGPSFPLPTPGLSMPPVVFKDLSTRLGNLEYKHRVSTRKMEEVSDAEVADVIAIGEIHPRVATMKEQVQTLQTALHGAELRRDGRADGKPEFDEMDDDDDDNVWGDDDEWLMAPVTPPRATVTVSSTYEMDNLEYRHGVLTRKMKEVSDAEVADRIAIEEIHLRVATVEEEVETLQTALHGAELQNQQLRTRVAEMESCEGTMMSYMLWMEERLTVLEKRL